MKITTRNSGVATRATLFAGVAALGLAMPSVAFAQDADDGAEEEGAVDDNVIIVTASKREQTLQETPISVSVTTGQTLEDAQIRDVLDLQTVAPSLRVSQLQTSSASTFIIRGFGNGDNNFGIEPSVGVFIDGVFRSRSAASLSDLPNVQRIEVLNGPQSTLFGKNASAGVISVVTREPQFEFGGAVEAVYGNFNNVVIKGDVTGPITDTIAFSLDGSYNRRDGYATIVNLNEEQNNRNRWSTRGQLLIEPTPEFKIRAIADYSKIDEVCCQVSTLVAGPVTGAINAVGGQLSTDFFSYDAFLNFVPTNEVENYGGSIQMDYETDTLQFTSITSYRELKNFFLSDIDYTSASIATETRDQSVETFTQEFRVASDFDGPINFLLGGYYFDESITQDSAIQNGSDIRTVFELLTPTGPGTFLVVETGLGLQLNTIFNTPLLSEETFAMDNTSYSIFGTVDFEPFDGLVITGGFNYTDDKKDFALSQNSPDPLGQVNLVDAFITLASGGTVTTRDQFQALPQANQDALLAAATGPGNPFLGLQAFQFQPPFLTIPNAVEDGKTRDDKFTYLGRVAYQVSDSINIYASYATGFKASSVNLSRDSRPSSADFVAGPSGSFFAAPDSPITNAGLAVANLRSGSRFAGPENAEVYELGFKGQWPGLSVNMAVFDQTIKGFQSLAFTGTGFALQNAGQQSVKGFELDSTINPADGLVLTFAMTYLDPLFDDFPGSVLGDLTGVTPAGIPEIAISTSATYSHEFGASGNMLVTRVDYNHESNTPINNGLPTFNAQLGNTQIFSREVNLVNASTTLKLENGIEVGAFVRNLLNNQYITTVFDGVAQAGTVSGYPSAPRTYGGVVRFKF
ncbi:TonB-dependent receptor [Pontixanthobacter aestiaquae]|uniref:TonB-dependent receptor n=1 Tax=Pontixanthobacter aestiaquae TaxID=1509367 RepID=A0A844ZAC1_9SPHN|nr:TonB-dependent receptor [Pontixanthobacter aestiaquae]MDN3644851.1 TonB-dependent receptor [Pontixanthobacter aestiaquae]MXO84146.1 TonB-dependent receptor [Pontixanthobacter aestiaquae]